MSATRDKSQKITFVYDNLYQLYKKGKDAAKNAEVATPPAFTPPPAPVSGRVLKAEEKAPFVVQTRTFTPPQFVGKQIELRQQRQALTAIPAAPKTQPQPPAAPKVEARSEGLTRIVPKPDSLVRLEAARKLDESLKANGSQNEAIKSLKDNLSTLNDLHGRLRFMLQELEDLVKDEE